MSVTDDTTVTQKADSPPRRRRRTASSGSTDGGPSVRAASAGSPSGGGEDSATPRPRSPRTPARQKRLEEFFGSMALPYSITGDEYAASLIAERAPAMAEAWAELATQNRGVARVLDRLMEGSAWGAVLISTGSVVVPLLGHHGIIPAIDPFGKPVPVKGGGGMPDWGSRRTIIPEPPEPTGDYMSPPVGPDAPPGTFTVAGSNNGAVMVGE